MKLYGDPIALNVHRSQVFIAEKGLDVPLVPVDLLGGENLKTEYLSKSPRGTMPVLELDDGTYIEESLAINSYLEALHPDPALLGTTPLERATVIARDHWIEFDGVGGAAEVFRNSFDGLKGRANPGISGQVDQIPALVERGQKRYASFIDLFERRLAGQDYVAGNFFSTADITGVSAIQFAQFVGLQIPEGSANTVKWMERCLARPSFAVRKMLG